MSSATLFHALKDGRLIFLREFLKHPVQLGTFVQSSRFLEHRVVEAADVGSARTIVELGPGTGGTTLAILRAMTNHARLLSIEINPSFHAFLSRLEDDRLIAHLGNALRLNEIISMYGLEPPEVVVSGIPFSTMSYAAGSQIVQTIFEALAPKGRLVAYQVNKRIASLCRPILGEGRVKVEFFNIPPQRVYRWDKNSS